ncbi:MAG: sulfatase family protein [Akkermansiaceae bacterium]
MRLFNLLRATLCSALASLASLLSATAQGEDSPPPNVVVLISDDQGYGDYGFMGHDMIETPRLDKLASESLVYRRGYVTTALCCPSLATMLTGQYPHEHRRTGNDPLKDTGKRVSEWIDYFSKQPQLPAMLRDAGYLTLHTGKYWHGDPIVSGFTDSMGKTGRHGSEYSLSIGRETMEPIKKFLDKAEQEQKPFMIWYAPFLPHTPHTPPERLLQKYVKAGAGSQAKYYAMCEWFDETCGDVLDRIEKRGLSQNTIVLYLCDNGWGSLGKGSVKSSPYELAVRTPIMIRWPGRVQAEMNDTLLASNLDLAPTVLRACGIAPAKTMSGINLLDRDTVTARKQLFLENFAHDMLDVHKPEASLRSRSCVEKDWKLTLWHELHPQLDIMGWQMQAPADKVQLFHLAEDPMERNNIAKEHPEKVAELTRKLNAWWNP